MTMGQEQPVVGTKKACCEDEANLRVIESTATMTVRRCTVCLCRHFEATLMPLDLKAKQQA